MESSGGESTAADPAYGGGGGRAGGFHNIDALPLGKLLRTSYGKSKGGSGSKKRSFNVSKLIKKGFK
jgi:hypothetical protein